MFLKASESLYFLVFFTVYISCFIILGVEHLLSAYGYLNKRRNIQKLIHSFSLIQRNHKPSILQCHSPQAKKEKKTELTTGTTVFLKASESLYFLVFFTVYISCFIINRLFPVNATLICFIVVKQSCMINPVVRKINISHFKDSASHRKFAWRVRKVKATVQ